MILAYGGFGGTAVESGTGAEFYFDSFAEENRIAGLAGPDEGFTRMQPCQLFGGEVEQSCIGFLNMLQPGWRIKTVQNDLRGKFNQ